MTLLAVLLACLPAVLPVEYILIGQRPDEGGAVHVGYQEDWAACCSAYSASTIGIYHPTPPVVWVAFQVHMAAGSEHDAVRLRVINSATGATFVSEALQPSVVGGPRTVGIWLDVSAWNARETEHQYVLEVRGAPVIYGAKLRVGYEGGL